MKRLLLGLAAAAGGLLFVSCLPLPGDAADVPAVQHVPYSGSFSYTVDAGSSPRDVYFVFTNPSTTSNAAAGLEVSGDVIRVDGTTLPAPAPQPLYAMNSAPRTAKERIDEFNRHPLSGLGEIPIAATGGIPAPVPDTVGDPAAMWDLGDNMSTISVDSTCQYVSIPAVTVADSTTRVLNIYVADDCWPVALGGTGVEGTNTLAGQKRHLVTQAMVNALAAKFLAADLNNDIYDWVTSVLGAEWGAHPFAATLIPPSGEITILLSDIEEDNSDTGGIVGYFYAGNNIFNPPQTDSNERIMFVIDAVMYANPDDDGGAGTGSAGWATTDFWAEECFSTLAHEFQHMIEFYQKQVLSIGNIYAGTDAWVGELCSMVIEDLVADKLGVQGPRGVAPTDPTAGESGNRNGRIPEFNYFTNIPLAVVSGYNLTRYYAVTYSFGSWLARNYGGVELVNAIVQSTRTDERAITGAILAVTGKQETLKSLLDKWSASVLLSDTTAAPVGYRYNTGGWTSSSAGGVTYNLGSINFFNYYQDTYGDSTDNLGPYAYTSDSDIPQSEPRYSTNLYYLAASAQSGSRTWEITLPENVVMSVVVK